MTGVTDPTKEYFKDGLWGWNENDGEWEKVTASDGKLLVSSVPELHAATHQDGGDDQVSVEGLSGDLADAQDAKEHAIGSATHSASTLAALNTKVSDATLDTNTATRTPSSHKATHAGGGSDKVKYTRQILFFLADAELATGTDKSATIIYRGPPLTLIRWDTRAKTAPTGTAIIADVNVGGTSLWNTTQANRPEIGATATSGTGTDFDTTTITDADVITLDIDQIGSATPGGIFTLILEGECNPEAD